MNQQSVTSHDAPIHDRQNLPLRPPVPLIGRAADPGSIHPALKAGTAVLLHGPAGIGKTTLAAALAADYADLSGGVIWLDLQHDTLHSLVLRLARALDVPPLTAHSPEAMDQQTQRVQDALKQTRPLLVLDGDMPVDTVRTFIRTCANGIPLIFMNAHMAAGSWTPYAVDPLSAADAAVLLNQYAESDDIDDPELLAVLGGYPLAIQVVGRQLAAGEIDPAQFREKMPKLPPGEANRVLGVLMTAYRLLPKDLQGLLLLLGTTFTSGASADLLAEVSKAPVQVINSKMRSLTDYGFAYERTVSNQTIFFTHELVKTFTQTFLRGKKQLDAMQTRHLTSLIAYTQRQLAAPAGEANPLVAEIPNLLAGGIFAAQHNVDTLGQLVQVLAPDDDASFIPAQGLQVEYEWLRLLLQQPELAELGILGEPEIEPDAADAILVGASFATPDAVSEFIENGMPTRAKAPVSSPPESTPPIQTEEPTSPVDEVSPELVSEMPAEPQPETADDMAAITPPKPAESTEPAQPAESPMAATPSPAVELPAGAEALEQLRQQAASTGDTEEVIAQYAQALDSYKADGNVEDELAALEALAQLNLASDNYEDVLKYLERGTTLAQEADNPQREGEMLVILGDLQMELGRFEGAEAAYKEAVSAFQPTGAWLNIGLALDKLAVVYDDTGRWQDAIDIWEQSLPIFEREQRTDLLRYVHGQIGDNHTDLMRWNQAKQNYDKALELAKADADEAGMFEEISRIAWLMETSGKHAEAVPYYQQALHLALKLDNQVVAGEMMLALARLLIDDTQQLNRVIQLLEEALNCIPGDTDIQRLLNRANQRKERLSAAGIDLPAAENSLQDYARAALETE